MGIRYMCLVLQVFVLVVRKKRNGLICFVVCVFLMFWCVCCEML